MHTCTRDIKNDLYMRVSLPQQLLSPPVSIILEHVHVHVACISTTNWSFTCTCTLIDGRGSCMFEVPVSYGMYICAE